MADDLTPKENEQSIFLQLFGFFLGDASFSSKTSKTHLLFWSKKGHERWLIKVKFTDIQLSASHLKIFEVFCAHNTCRKFTKVYHLD